MKAADTAFFFYFQTKGTIVIMHVCEWQSNWDLQ